MFVTLEKKCETVLYLILQISQLTLLYSFYDMVAVD